MIKLKPTLFPLKMQRCTTVQVFRDFLERKMEESGLSYVKDLDPLDRFAFGDEEFVVVDISEWDDCLDADFVWVVSVDTGCLTNLSPEAVVKKVT